MFFIFNFLWFNIVVYGGEILKKNLYFLGIIVLINAIVPQYAFAYLDPGTGSMILQMLIAGCVGVGCTFNIWKDKVIGLFKKGNNDKQ